jgi:hypothetical protein
MRNKNLKIAFLAVILFATLNAAAREIGPNTLAGGSSEPSGIYSDRTLVLALDIQSAGASLLFFTAKDRPFIAPLAIPEPAAAGEQASQLEVVLWGPSGETYTRRMPLRGICLDHPAGTDAHIKGDTIRVHRDTVIVEVPAIAWYDTVETAYYKKGERGIERFVLGVSQLLPESYTKAAGTIEYRDLDIRPDLAFSAPQIELLTPGTVHWPAEYGDTDIYTVYGSASEVSSRINIVLVPDGYTYAQKSTMQTHAQALVNYFRGKTPFKEHDAFINYILVYAYSTQSGTDQCDCSIVKDTAMNTRFPTGNPTCGHSDNRCLYYGTGNGGTNCDPNTSAANISAAELRAPADDITLVMVNTTRYGGCGGSRAVYSAGYSGSCPAEDIGVHELGHSLAGLADEYTAYTTCGTYAGELNTSLNATSGAWPEWIADIGAPRQGADYYSLCIYRPETACEMRSLCTSFCRVCNQQWALTFFGHPRVDPTAPVRGQTPASSLSTPPGVPVNFSVDTRLATGTSVTNTFTWTLQGPGYPSPTVVSTGSPAYSRSFSQAGAYTLTCEVVADTNFVKPSKNDTNRATVDWVITAAAPSPGETSPSGSPMTAAPSTGTTIQVSYSPTSCDTNHSIYWGVSSAPLSGLAWTGSACGLGDTGSATFDPGALPAGSFFYFVIVGNNGTSEGSYGKQTGDIERPGSAACISASPDTSPCI